MKKDAASKPCKCVFRSCKEPVAFIAHKLWGKGGHIVTCAKHKPGFAGQPESQSGTFYRIEPIQGA